MKVTNAFGITYELSDSEATQIAAMEVSGMIKASDKDSIKVFEWWVEQLKEVLLSGKWSKLGD